MDINEVVEYIVDNLDIVIHEQHVFNEPGDPNKTRVIFALRLGNVEFSRDDIILSEEVVE